MNINDIDKSKMYDVIVVGGGPAGLTSAIYLARAKYRVLVIEKENFGGQITITEEVVNYPGVLKTSGAELTETMRVQAENFGAEFISAEVKGLDVNGDIKTVSTSRGDLYAYGIVYATGAHPRMIGFKGEADFKGRGVAYCATCDGEFFTDKEVFVVGGGFAAAEESVFLTKFAKHVTVLVRKDDFSCAASVSEKTKNHEKITVVTNVDVEEVNGDDNGVNYIRYKNSKTGEVTEYKSDENFGVFVFAGYEPETALLEGITELDRGYVVTDANRKTNVDGLYAAGDVCIKTLRQVVTAVADGAIAATELEKYAAELHEKVGFAPEVKEEKAPAQTESNTASTAKDSSGLFNDKMLAQLKAVFDRMESKVILKLYLDNSDKAEELKNYMNAVGNLTDKIVVENTGETADHMPCVKVYRENGQYTGLGFHGVPGGHEFTSFILGLYNASGSGQSIDEAVKTRIENVKEPIDMKVLVSLSCTMCPDLVVAAQKMATLNDNITSEVYDVMNYEDLKSKYNVQSVPCLVINDKDISFGKKNIEQLVDLLAEKTGSI